MNTCFSSPLLLLMSISALLFTTATLHAQHEGRLLGAIAEGGPCNRTPDTLSLRAVRSRVPEMPVGAARSVRTALSGGMVTSITVTGAAGVEQRLWIPEGMVLYNESVEIADEDGDGVPEVTAAGARGGRIGRCIWNYRPTVERYNSRARLDFPAEEARETEE